MHSTNALLPYNCLSHIFVFLLFVNPYLFILKCDIFPFYLYSCLSHPSILDHPVSVSEFRGS